MVRLNKIHFVFLFVFIGIIFTGCPEDTPEKDTFISICNNSDHKLVWFFNFMQNKKIDTSLCNDFPFGDTSRVNDEYIIFPGNCHKDKFNSYRMKDYLKENGWYIYYIFNYDTLMHVPWQEIRDEYKVAKRVDFDTWEDMENCDFTIVYPDSCVGCK